jgi:hypothetical protein
MAQSWRPGQGEKISALYAWVAEEPDGGEGVCSAEMELFGKPVHMPLVGADLDRVKSLRHHAETLRRATGWPVRLVRYAHREEMEELS